MRNSGGKSADLNLGDNHGKTPSHLAAERNHPGILEYMTERGIDTELGDDKGKRPSHYAAIHGGLECLVFLVQIDCDMTKAAQHGAMTCLHWLFEKGVNPYAKDGQGNTPLHMAAVGGHGKCFNCCLQHNSSLEIQNNREETAIDIARRFGHPVVIDKAVHNTIQCLHCVGKYEILEWQKSHQPTKVQRSLNSSKKQIYRSPVPPAKKELSQAELNRLRREAEQSKGDHLPKRDLAAKYFGEHFDGMWQVTGK
uniref:Serine/threonine-protein phosphatase 6 regulatory ankyrin repeat subunit A-like n=1 Tax=Saccoglossus kowalevskii TaxID=10224 RepID=A0ABM0MPT0_SACKO|nr:PREDICTED: serine/threonine-protein phosphatase 6 regulatory ankyrin repeat subunit A-like [Saccoglossus kowalevskii]